MISSQGERWRVRGEGGEAHIIVPSDVESGCS